MEKINEHHVNIEKLFYKWPSTLPNNPEGYSVRRYVLPKGNQKVFIDNSINLSNRQKCSDVNSNLTPSGSLGSGSSERFTVYNKHRQCRSKKNIKTTHCKSDGDWRKTK